MSNPQLRSVILADPSHVVPWPGVNGRFLPANEPFEISILDPFWAALLADRTLVAAPPPAKSTGKPKA